MHKIMTEMMKSEISNHTTLVIICLNPEYEATSACICGVPLLPLLPPKTFPKQAISQQAPELIHSQRIDIPALFPVLFYPLR